MNFLYLCPKNLYTDNNVFISMEVSYVSFMGKLWKDNHMVKDTVIEDNSEDTRTHKVFRGLEEICYEFDLENPIWLDSSVSDFKRHSKTRFCQDSFIEQIDFDYLEIQVIEED